jgi:AraC-like DNA-binding protein
LLLPGRREENVPDILGQSSDTSRPRLRNSLPASYPRQFVEIAAERGIAPERVLAGTALTLAALDSSDRRVSASDAAAVLRNALALTGDDGLGLEWGLRTRPTAHGYVGFAAMSAGTLREALELSTRFVHLRQRDTGLSARVEGDSIVLEARENHELGGLRRVFFESIMVGFYTMSGFLLGEPRLAGEIWFDWPEPDYFERFRARLPAVRFAAPSLQVRLSAIYLDRRLIMPDATAVRSAVEQCEREQALSDPGPDNLLERVRAQLAPGPDGYADLERVAARLFMSGRTLKRKLQERGTTFRALLDDARFRQAQNLLENPDLDIQQVAIALGYRDPACFTRAFRRWSGRTPSQARAERRAAAQERPPATP